ncbi:hypothetical protein [Moritella viscosa]|uniref:Hep/Hag repeat protein n=1 Tax=Moritella viscosa TaxID=80854 RepID=A0ABY1HL28_9GAMM|nr:hypothetical protein [Moritella viscosa]SGY98600.1 Hep/Hag repeat protein [Moritella viscosa]SGZ05694.1 Hep/Hag repeat protein [Moritella viscosa]SGZ12780.1 Hep/Hag repeat protein [Moritella viscosa]SHO27754.1 Hep/Hag repeat protein [Moritella viscosa]
MKNVGIGAVLMLISVSASAGESLDICLVTGTPPTDIKYEKIQRIKIGKGTYGSVTDILPAFADKANSLGANAVVNYIGSQRFGFWPWRFIRPIVRGEAVKLYLDNGKTCQDIGGSTVKRVIETNKEPHLI